MTFTKNSQLARLSFRALHVGLPHTDLPKSFVKSGLLSYFRAVLVTRADALAASTLIWFVAFLRPGFYFSNFERGLVNYEKPNHTVKAVPHVNSSGQLCGAFFKVDSQAQMENAMKSGRGMHQVGSEVEINPWQY